MSYYKLLEALREQITGNYFCDPSDDGEREIWEPFENWDIDDIEAQIEIDIIVMNRFIDKNKDLIIDYLNGVK